MVTTEMNRLSYAFPVRSFFPWTSYSRIRTPGSCERCTTSASKDSLGSFCQKSRPRLCLIETTAADLRSPQHFWSALPQTERHKRRLILPARIRAETGYGDRVAPQLRSGHEPEERLPQPRPEQRAAAQLAQAAAAGARAHPWGRVVAGLLQPRARWRMRVQPLRQPCR